MIHSRHSLRRRFGARQARSRANRRVARDADSLSPIFLIPEARVAR